MPEKKNVSEKPQLKQVYNALTDLLQKQKKNQTTFLIKHKESLIPFKASDFAYFIVKSGIVKGTTFNNKSVIIDKKLNELETNLNPLLFFRINRQFIIQRTAVKRISNATNGKLSIIVSQYFTEQILVSKAKSRHFKKWMDDY